MPPQLALAITTAFVIYVLKADKWRTENLSRAMFWPTLWYLVVSTHPIGVWFVMWNLPVLGSDSDTAADGSPIDRLFYGALTLVGLYVLSRRRVRWQVLMQANPWLVLFMAYLFLSIGWSDFMMVSLKRYVKVYGSIVMALIVLTENDRVEALAALIRRVAYIHMPMSILVTRYFRDIGVSWDYMGSSASLTGCASTKNVLGQIAMLSAITFIWERTRRGNPKRGRWIDYAYIAMSIYLLKGDEAHVSMTSVTVFALALAVFWALRTCRLHPQRAQPIFMTFVLSIFTLLLFIIIHSVVHFPEDSLFGSIITLVGRDITLTGRTETIWHDVYHVAARNPLFGVGFGGFWIGRMANIPWNENMSWILGQGHSGYVDSYMQIGFFGIFLLMLLLFAIARDITTSIITDFEYGRFRAILFCVIIYTNITESSYLRGDHNLWLIFLMAALNVPLTAWNSPKPKPVEEKKASRPDEEEEEEPDRIPHMTS